MITPMSERTNQSIYLEWLHEWNTTSEMAENYGRTLKEMKTLIDLGRIEHKKYIMGRVEIMSSNNYKYD